MYCLVLLINDGEEISRKPLLSAPQLTDARKLPELGKSPAYVVQLLKISRRTVERALANEDENGRRH
jgi:hypothetical protein